MAATHSVTGPHDVNMHPALSGGAVGLISADNPGHSNAATQRGHEALARELDKLGYEYEPTRGAYGAKERSYIVHSPRVEDLVDLGRKFGQEAVVYSVGGKHFGIYTNGDDVGKYSPGEGHKYTDTEPENYFTAIPTPNGGAGFFQYNIDWSKKQPFDASQVGQAQTEWDAAKQTAEPKAQELEAGEGSGGLVKSISAPEAAKRILKAAVEAYHGQLLELRKKELEKAMATPLPGAAAGAFKPAGVQNPAAALAAAQANVKPFDAGALNAANKMTTMIASGDQNARGPADMSRVVNSPERAAATLASAPVNPNFNPAALIAANKATAAKPPAGIAAPIKEPTMTTKKEVIPSKSKAAQGGQQNKGPHPAFAGVRKEEPKAEGKGKPLVAPVAAGKDPKEVKGGKQNDLNATASAAGAPIEAGGKPKAHPQGFAGSPLLDLMRDQAAKATKAKGDAPVAAVAAGQQPKDVAAGKEINKDEMRLNNAAKGGSIAPGSSAAKHPATRHLKAEIEAGKVPAQGGQIAPGNSAGSHPATAKLGKAVGLWNGSRRFAAPAAAPASVGSGPHTFDAAAWASNAPGCKQCGAKFANPVQVLLAGDSGACGKCSKANMAAAAPAGIAPVVKQESMIDLGHESSPDNRIKDVEPVKGTKTPKQAGKETGWANGNTKPKEVSVEESPEVTKGKLKKAEGEKKCSCGASYNEEQGDCYQCGKPVNYEETGERCEQCGDDTGYCAWRHQVASKSRKLGKAQCTCGKCKWCAPKGEVKKVGLDPNPKTSPAAAASKQAFTARAGGLGKTAIPQVAAAAKPAAPAAMPGTGSAKPAAIPKIPTAKPAGVPGAPKVPKAPGAA